MSRQPSPRRQSTVWRWTLLAAGVDLHMQTSTSPRTAELDICKARTCVVRLLPEHPHTEDASENVHAFDVVADLVDACAMCSYRQITGHCLGTLLQTHRETGVTVLPRGVLLPRHGCAQLERH